MQDTLEMENFKILRSIWKNTYDKILEIKITNRRSWNEMKSSIMEEEKKKMDIKFDKEYNEQFIQNKIQISKARSESNLSKMTTKNILVDQLIEATLKKIEEFAKPDNLRYVALMKDLIIEGMVKLLEPSCIIRVRKVDVPFVKRLLPDCEREFAEKMKKETERDYECSLVVDENQFLESQSGGIHLLSSDKKLELINDLESRLNLAKEQHLPVIKRLLFPKKDK